MHHSQNMIITLSRLSDIKITIQKMKYKNKCVGFLKEKCSRIFIHVLYTLKLVYINT